MFSAFSRLLLLPLLAGAVLLSGCQTAQTFPTPTPAWQSYSGQMRYAGPRSVVGEVVVRRSGAAEFQLGFSSGPGFPLLQVRESGGRARAEGALARGSWQGNASGGPTPLRGWLELREVFAALPGHDGAFTQGDWQAKAHYEGGRLQHLEVIYPARSERFVFHFGR